MQRPVYLDNAATTPMDPLVFEAMKPWFLERYGNSSSASHLFGWEARDAVEEAREQVATLIGGRAREVCFTSGATESVNLALKGVAESFGFASMHIVTCSTEHSAVLDACRHLERLGCRVTRIGVDAEGCLDLDEVADAVEEDTRLFAFMHANNETGVLHPIEELASLAREKGILLLCDATQTVGKMPLSVDRLGVDLMAFSAHKFHGPKGVGALYVRKRDETAGLVAQLDGGRQERGLRSGTLNVPGIVGMGVAGGLASQRMHADMDAIGSNRERLEASLLRIPGVRLNGQPAGRLHTISNLTFEGRDGFAILRANAVAFAASPGSACSSTVQHPSHVLKAMGLTDHQAGASVRFSLGRFNTRDEVDLVILALEGYLGALP
jgi:cysteine desulfurase